ncbi:hypothetical protein J7E73_20895 [Paenibacillus albidus]|uniref:hypothetical protein n=1 Tax=Paenibacillus albidus TaxID=2041023 RepID=UPI001BE96B16|nr:hypothetical protein [Paenibacillus albidus]MBT2291536.1 hypothetical protein [Paenibacillus albidus]
MKINIPRKTKPNEYIKVIGIKNLLFQTDLFIYGLENVGILNKVIWYKWLVILAQSFDSEEKAVHYKLLKNQANLSVLFNVQFLYPFTTMSS